MDELTINDPRDVRDGQFLRWYLANKPDHHGQSLEELKKIWDAAWDARGSWDRLLPFTEPHP